ncbi:MAG: hypothetical protein Q7U16_04425 [Agitococcus sp.]|nr:hypothetical protein [Agitococcus sp.]
MFFTNLSTPAEKKRGLADYASLLTRFVADCHGKWGEQAHLLSHAVIILDNEFFKIGAERNYPQRGTNGIYLLRGAWHERDEQQSVSLADGVPLNWTSFVAKVSVVSGRSEEYIWNHAIDFFEFSGKDPYFEDWGMPPPNWLASASRHTLHNTHLRRGPSFGQYSPEANPLYDALLTPLVPIVREQGAQGQVSWTPLYHASASLTSPHFQPVFIQEYTPQVKRWANRLIRCAEYDASPFADSHYGHINPSSLRSRSLTLPRRIDCMDVELDVEAPPVLQAPLTAPRRATQHTTPSCCSLTREPPRLVIARSSCTGTPARNCRVPLNWLWKWTSSKYSSPRCIETKD